MRQVLFAGLSVVVLVAIVTPSSAALARARGRAPALEATSTSPVGLQDRFCLQGYQWGYPGNCEFSTYAQCLATASGTDSGCGENPQYLFRAQRRGDWPPR